MLVPLMGVGETEEIAQEFRIPLAMAKRRSFSISFYIGARVCLLYIYIHIYIYACIYVCLWVYVHIHICI